MVGWYFYLHLLNSSSLLHPKEFVFLKIDFDKQKADLRKLKASSQSTLIVFKGEKEVGRSVGDTKPKSVEAMVAKALTVAPTEPAVATAPAVAPTVEKFTSAAFEAAQKSGKPILIDVFAASCLPCKAQTSIIEELAKNEKFKDFAFLRMDFGGQKDAVRKFKASSEGTLIVFKGEKEVGRSVGDTKPEIRRGHARHGAHARAAGSGTGTGRGKIHRRGV